MNVYHGSLDDEHDDVIFYLFLKLQCIINNTLFPFSDTLVLDLSDDQFHMDFFHERVVLLWLFSELFFLSYQNISNDERKIMFN